jgi:hypothetical protein
MRIGNAMTAVIIRDIKKEGLWALGFGLWALVLGL